MDLDLNNRYKPVKLCFNSCSTVENHDELPIIFVHGLFATSSTWNRVRCQISNKTRRRAYTFDLRNHGQSEYTEEFTVRHMAADLLQLIKDQNIQKAVLVGHSAGGRIVMELALQKPELVEKLVVEDILISDAPDDMRMSLISLCKAMSNYVSKLPPSFSEQDVKYTMKNLLKKFLPKFSTNGRASSDIVNAIPCYKDQKTGEFHFNCNMPVLIEFLENPSRAWINLSNDPVYPGETLFISGEHTVLNMEEDRELALKHFPQSQFVTLQGSYHVSHTECPEKFINAVSDFILSKKENS